MNGWVRFLVALAVAAVVMLGFRAICLTVYVIPGEGLQPFCLSGDRVLVNRWSYGLRIGGGGLVPYSRIGHRYVRRGDVVAFDSPVDSLPGVFIARCLAVPGDTLPAANGPLMVPGLADCADGDYYWLEAVGRDNPVDSRHLGFIPERCIIGRVVTILYSHDDRQNIFQGYRPERTLKTP